jgi:hypothetical protein
LRIVLAAITIAFYSEVGVADAYFNAEKSAKICGICGKLKFRLGLPFDPSNFRIVLAAITIDFYSEIGVADAYFNAVKISENQRYLRETKISSRTTVRSFQLSKVFRNYTLTLLTNSGRTRIGIYP